MTVPRVLKRQSDGTERMRQHDVVLCIQDITELDFNGQSIEGLGVLDAWMWAREGRDAGGGRGGVKESIRWIEGYERIAEQASALPSTRLVYIADREADILALKCKARELGEPVDWLIRSKHNRSLPGGDKLWAKATSDEAIGTLEFLMPSRVEQKARKVWVQAVSLRDGRRGTL